MQCHCEDLPGFAGLLGDVAQIHRLQIICLLSKVEFLCVCEIIVHLGISQNLVSHHLKVLKATGLLRSKREGKNIYYAIDREKLNQFVAVFSHIFTHN